MSIIASLRVKEEENRQDTLKFIMYICKSLLTVLILGILWLIDSSSVSLMFHTIKDFLPIALEETFGTCFINLFVISIMYGLTGIFAKFIISILILAFLLLLFLILIIVVIYAKITE